MCFSCPFAYRLRAVSRGWSPGEPGTVDLPGQTNDRITRRAWMRIEVSSFPIMERKRKWIVGGERGYNGLLCVCLMTWSGKESPKGRTPHRPKARGNVSERATSTIVVMRRERVMNLGSEPCFFKTPTKQAALQRALYRLTQQCPSRIGH